MYVTKTQYDPLFTSYDNMMTPTYVMSPNLR